MRFRPHVLSLRSETALAAIDRDRSITDAVRDRGFADSSHFARTFKRMFGVPAASGQRAASPFRSIRARAASLRWHVLHTTPQENALNPNYTTTCQCRRAAPCGCAGK